MLLILFYIFSEDMRTIEVIFQLSVQEKNERMIDIVAKKKSTVHDISAFCTTFFHNFIIRSDFARRTTLAHILR